jgi:hypothetical protein
LTASSAGFGKGEAIGFKQRRNQDSARRAVGGGELFGLQARKPFHVSPRRSGRTKGALYSAAVAPVVGCGVAVKAKGLRKPSSGEAFPKL